MGRSNCGTGSRGPRGPRGPCTPASVEDAYSHSYGNGPCIDDLSTVLKMVISIAMNFSVLVVEMFFSRSQMFIAIL